MTTENRQAHKTLDSISKSPNSKVLTAITVWVVHAHNLSTQEVEVGRQLLKGEEFLAS